MFKLHTRVSWLSAAAIEGIITYVEHHECKENLLYIDSVNTVRNFILWSSHRIHQHSLAIFASLMLSRLLKRRILGYGFL